MMSDFLPLHSLFIVSSTKYDVPFPSVLSEIYKNVVDFIICKLISGKSHS